MKGNLGFQISRKCVDTMKSLSSQRGWRTLPQGEKRKRFETTLSCKNSN